MRKFAVVEEYKNQDINIPKRATKHSAGYDIEAAADTLVPSLFNMMQHLIINKHMPDIMDNYSMADVKEQMKTYHMAAVKVPTGLKVYLEPGEFLDIRSRSGNSSNCLLVLANGCGTVDRDYVDNTDNEGHIMVPIINLSPYNILIKKGEKIAQGIICRYHLVDDEDVNEVLGIRSGGFGSTSN